MGSSIDFFLLGLDSFVVCVGLGAVERSPRTWVALAIAFGVADALGTASGLVLGRTHSHPPSGLAVLAPIAVALYGCLVAAAQARARASTPGRLGLVLLPVLLSLDNFAAGLLGDYAPSIGPALGSAFAATSIMAFLGCVTGALLARIAPVSERVLPAGSAFAAALVMGLA